MEVLTKGQKLLIEYLTFLGIPRVKGMYIVGILWEEEATKEMLEYIAKTRESDLEKLSSIACEISEKYNIKRPG